MNIHLIALLSRRQLFVTTKLTFVNGKVIFKLNASKVCNN